MIEPRKYCVGERKMNGGRRIGSVEKRGAEFQITLDGREVSAYAGETIATVLLAEGDIILRRTSKEDKPRSVFCGIGICFDCLVTVNGVPNQRACMTLARPGCVVSRQRVFSRGAGEKRG